MNNIWIRAVVWSVVITAFGYWMEKALAGFQFVDNTLVLAVLIAPAIEESCKFIAMRQFKRLEVTIIVPLVFILFETINFSMKNIGAFTDSGMVGLMVVLGALWSILILKHLLFWGTMVLGNVRGWVLPVVILEHVVWNLYPYFSSSEDSIAAAGIALNIGLLIFFMMRKRKYNLGGE